MSGENGGALAAALVAFQKDAPAIRKDAVNPHFKNRYASLDSIMDAVRAPLAKCGLAISQHPTITETGFPALRTILLHTSGDILDDVMPLSVDKPGPQAQGSALTYARRYAVLAVLGLVADEDDDANAAEKPAGARKDAASSDSPSGPSAPEDAAALTAELLALAEKLDATGATMEGIENNLAKGDPAGHVEWLKKCIATATEQLRLDESPFKAPAVPAQPKPKSKLSPHASRTWKLYKEAEEKGQVDKAAWDEYLAEKGVKNFAKITEAEAADIQAWLGDQLVPF